MIKLFRHLDIKERLMVLCGVLFVIVQVWLELKMPEYMSEITVLIETPGSEISGILKNGGYMLACAVGSMIATIATGYFAAIVSASLSLKLRSKLFRKVMSFNEEEMAHFSTASLITRTTNDITQVQMLVAMGLQIITKTPIMLVWGILKIMGKEWQWSAATAAAVMLIILVIMLAVFFALPKFKIIQKLTDDLNRVTRENLTGIRVIRAYNAEGYQQKKFDDANSALTESNLFANRITALLMPTMTFITSAISLAIYWIGAYLLNGAEMMEQLTIFSDMVVFSQYAMQVIMAFAMLTVLFVMLPRVMVSVYRINEVLDMEVKIKDGTISAQENGEKGSIEFRNVSFAYPGGGDTLHNISFTVAPGETAAIIGATGSGKSTLVNLISRFYDAGSGEILVDGVNIRDYTLSALREKIGYVSQKAVLFAGSVASNVAFGQENVSDEKLKAAVSVSQSEEFVKSMQGEYEADIAQGGSNLSGGQRQRLSIARAVYKEPEIYIFDDSFSALDYKTDRILRKKLAECSKGSTKLIVAQRIGTIRHAHRIIVLEDGQIVGNGTHDELLKNCPTYREIAYSQLSEEELRNE
ncbi:MAG: ABC transporter ATP-binding protein [Huintestinicola sp.]